MEDKKSLNTFIKVTLTIYDRIQRLEFNQLFILSNKFFDISTIKKLSHVFVHARGQYI